MTEDQIRMGISKEINYSVGDLSGILTELDMRYNATVAIALEKVMDDLKGLSAEIVRKEKP